jgi:hypothetical protein
VALGGGGSKANFVAPPFGGSDASVANVV